MTANIITYIYGLFRIRMLHIKTDEEKGA